MMKFSNIGRLLTLLAIALVGLSACNVEVDYTLGGNLVPENQQMKAGHLVLDNINPRKFVETRLYQTDSIVSSNVAYGYFGASRNEQLGTRSAGFMTQLTNFYAVDSGYFGYRPIFDSIQLLVNLSSYGGDTTCVQEFAIYEVTSNDYLKDKEDSVFYLNYNPEEQGVVGDEVLFTFSVGGKIGPSKKAITLTPTEAGRAYVDRLFLKEGNYKNDYSIYSPDSIKQWLEEFKGIYIRPVNEEVASDAEGAIYSTLLEESALSIYGRNRRKEDPTLIKDTIGMVLYFIDTQYGNSNVSVNHFNHDYSQGSMGLDITTINETATERAETGNLIIEGMGGVISQLTFTEEYFARLEQILKEEYEESGKTFSTLAFSQAMMHIYFPSSIYDYLSITPSGMGEKYQTLIDEMDNAQSRLGMYLDFKNLNNISDYAYSAEGDGSLDYGGYINRSHGCYAMNITGYMQQLWNAYREECRTAEKEGREVDIEKVQGRTIYLGPEAYSCYTYPISFVQGVAADESQPLEAPIRITLTYNMIR